MLAPGSHVISMLAALLEKHLQIDSVCSFLNLIR